jgi:hypothetical protein
LATELDAQRLYSNALCGGLHELFDSTDPADFLEAEQFCLRCPVRTECAAVVDPGNSWYDGTCSGRFYIDGEDVTSYDGKVTHDFSELTTDQLSERYADLYATYADEPNRHKRVKLGHELLALARELKIKGTVN